MPQLLCQQPFPTPDEGRDGDAAAADCHDLLVTDRTGFIGIGVDAMGVDQEMR